MLVPKKRQRFHIQNYLENLRIFPIKNIVISGTPQDPKANDKNALDQLSTFFTTCPLLIKLQQIPIIERDNRIQAAPLP